MFNFLHKNIFNKKYNAHTPRERGRKRMDVFNGGDRMAIEIGSKTNSKGIRMKGIKVYSLH